MASQSSRTIYLVATGAPLTRRAADFVPEAEARGWQPAIIATNSAQAWLDEDKMKGLDVPVLTGHRSPDQAKRLPPAGAVVLAPGTFNTINKLATGIADTYALSVLCEAISLRTPMVIVPFVSSRLSGHPAWLASLAVLRYAGATLVDPRDGAVNVHEPPEADTGDTVTDHFHWSWALDRVHSSA